MLLIGVGPSGGPLRCRASRSAPLLAAVLTLPYAWPYIQAARTLGGRDLAEIARYSAQPINYLSATSLSWLWGWTADRWGGRELRLFPGVVAVALAAFSVANRSWRWTVLYVRRDAAIAIELSFGTNGALLSLAVEHVDALRGFRSASRFAMLAMCALAMLAGLGTQAHRPNVVRVPDSRARRAGADHPRA